MFLKQTCTRINFTDCRFGASILHTSRAVFPGDPPSNCLAFSRSLVQSHLRALYGLEWRFTETLEGQQMQICNSEVHLTPSVNTTSSVLGVSFETTTDFPCHRTDDYLPFYFRLDSDWASAGNWGYADWNGCQTGTWNEPRLHTPLVRNSKPRYGVCELTHSATDTQR